MTTEKKALVVGLAKSGIPAVKALNTLGYQVDLNDLKPESAFSAILPTLEGNYHQGIFGGHPDSVKQYDRILVSPGVPLDLPFLQEARSEGIEIIGELELGFQLAKGSFYAITGTNGKTTTTALTGEIFKAAGLKTLVAGNIGHSVVDLSDESDEQTHWITEVSSFQLETIKTFHPQVSAILNVTPDHLNRHKTMENYIAAKSRIFENSNSNDVVILNADNHETYEISKNIRGPRVVLFSRLKLIEDGIYCDPESGDLILCDPVLNRKIQILNRKEIFIPGSHNLENAMAAAAIAYYAGIQVTVIAEVLRSFKGVEHRIEFVDDIRGVLYYNDSKGTNPDASIKAVEAMVRPTILIAGGMDKGSTFDELIEAFDGHVVKMIVFGETAELLLKTAEKSGFSDVVRVHTLDEAVKLACESAAEGWSVLLSPACASWDMYDNFEQRGEHFKRCVRDLR